MKIIMIIPDLGIGGAERSFSKLSLQLAQHAKIKVVVFNDIGKVIYPIGGDILSLNVGASPTLVGKLINFIRRVRRLKKVKQEFDADLCISFLEGADYINLLAKTRVPHIISIRGSKYFDGNIKGIQGFIRKKILIPFLYKRASAIICVNQGIEQELIRYFGLSKANLKVIYNGYDKNELDEKSGEPISDKFGSVFREPYIVICSRLAPEKRTVALVKVFIAMITLGYKGRLVVIGDGPSLIDIEQLLASEKISAFPHTTCEVAGAQIVFTGADPSPYKYIRSADLFLMASESEGFPNSLIEAMSLGVPVASADCPWGPREILNDDFSFPFQPVEKPEKALFGMLMPPLNDSLSVSDPVLQQWARSLYDLLQDKEKLDYYKNAGLQRAASFSIEKNTESWLQLLGEQAAKSIS